MVLEHLCRIRRGRFMKKPLKIPKIPTYREEYAWTPYRIHSYNHRFPYLFSHVRTYVYCLYSDCGFLRAVFSSLLLFLLYCNIGTCTKHFRFLNSQRKMRTLGPSVHCYTQYVCKVKCKCKVLRTIFTCFWQAKGTIFALLLNESNIIPINHSPSFSK